MTNLNDITFKRNILIKKYIHEDDNKNSLQRIKVKKRS
jgi:hypothetical protein